MKNKVTLVMGIAGQDGSYLAEYLLDIGSDVRVPVSWWFSCLKILSKVLKIITVAIFQMLD